MQCARVILSQQTKCNSSARHQPQVAPDSVYQVDQLACVLTTKASRR